MSDKDDDLGNLDDLIPQNASLDVYEALQSALDGDFSVSLNGTDKLSLATKEILSRLSEQDGSSEASATNLSVQIDALKEMGVSRASKTLLIQAARDLELALDVIQKTRSDIRGFGKFVRSISDSASNIKKIAMQTNLLAINASIEASRAGDAGKGFAVVADAVKQLSGQSASATRQIEDILTEFDHSLSTITSNIQDSHSKVKEGVDNVEEQTHLIHREAS